MILTLCLLLILAYIILISPKNLSIFLPQFTKHSATTFKKKVCCFSALHIFINFWYKNNKLIIQYSCVISELLRFHYRMASSKPTSWKHNIFIFLYLTMLISFNKQSRLFPFRILTFAPILWLVITHIKIRRF